MKKSLVASGVQGNCGGASCLMYCIMFHIAWIEISLRVLRCLKVAVVSRLYLSHSLLETPIQLSWDYDFGVSYLLAHNIGLL